MTKSVKVLDTIGLICPLPVLKAERAMASLPQDQELVVLASDPLSVVDIPHMCRERGYHLIKAEREGEAYAFRIRHRLETFEG